MLIHAIRPAEPHKPAKHVEITIDDRRSQDWKAVFGALHRIGYDGLITVIEHRDFPAKRERICKTYPRLIRQWWEQSACQSTMDGP